jgi:glycosyltransferase involved in cell wall biosynthesis
VKPVILICAYACAADPSTKFFGGGDLLAWNLVKRLSRVHRLWVLTASQNYEAIQAARKEDPLPDVQFVYVALPGWLGFLLRHQGGIQFYAYLWQWRAYFVARRLHKQIRFDVFHHLTYENDWMASIIGALLPVPYVRGPAGGSHRVPRRFRRQFPTRSYLWEYIRMGLQWVFRHDPFFAIGHGRAKVLLMANREAVEALPRRWRKKAQLLSVNGVSLASVPYEGPPGERLALSCQSSVVSGRPRVSSPEFPVPTPLHHCFPLNPKSKIENQKSKNGHFQLLTAGRLVPLKGFDLAIRAFKTFIEGRIQDPGLRTLDSGLPTPDPGLRTAQLTIVGDGPERPRLQALIGALGLEDRVRLVNWMRREDLFREMARCDAFVFPSLRDGGGLVVVEAMAAGKPVICLDLGGPGLHVTQACGLKVPASSPEQAVRELACGLQRLYVDPLLRQQLGQAARQRAQEVYDWDRVAERILATYQDLGLKKNSEL